MVEAVAESMSPTQVHKGDSRLGHGGSFAAVASTFQASFAVALTAIIDLEMALGQCQKLVPQANHAVGAPPPPGPCSFWFVRIGTLWSLLHLCLLLLHFEQGNWGFSLDFGHLDDHAFTLAQKP